MCSSTWPSCETSFYLSVTLKPHCPNNFNKESCIILTCEGVFPLDWARYSWRPAPACWPAGLPRPWCCGCSNLEEFLPRGSSWKHLLLESGKAWGEYGLPNVNSRPPPGQFLKRAFKLNPVYHHSSKRSPFRRLKLTWRSQDGSPGRRCAAESLRECWQPAGHNGHWGGAPRYPRCQKMLPSGGICSLPRRQDNMRQQLYNLWGFKI